ncbi:hypothetical protein HUG10_16660 [Halorarum halophilum]|uniref:DUF7344 domain-containing protein n=1 Tax=Halorarum halophilum TaxID=2743090 RepID=A0A7D5K2R5_9EURY|nr:hypothetical protein [Halobaculum halophilum]QLG29061.1 hypothetical protein HUG10_16660 [Halobaculum halophilum]
MSQSSSEFTGERTGTDDLTESDRHRLLAAEHRRIALDILEGRTAPVELEELAVGVVGRENGPRAADVETVERVAIMLHHVHLPKMAEFGVVDYDPDTNRVESCPARRASSTE